MLEVGFIALGIVIGFTLAWFISKSKTHSLLSNIKDVSKQEFTALDKDYGAYKAVTTQELSQLKRDLQQKEFLVQNHQITIEKKQNTLAFLEKENSLEIQKLEVASKELAEVKNVVDTLNFELKEQTKKLNQQLNNTAIVQANYDALQNTLTEKEEELSNSKNELQDSKEKINTLHKTAATADANNTALQEKLKTQKEEIETLGKKFNTEFKNIASEILKDNTKVFSEVNENKIKALLNPLGENIKEFKQKVQDVYNQEAKERFSLGEKVKELAEKSEKISQDAINLTNALKGEAKTQGNWGEMILESILEKSGLRKDQEYFMEHQLTGEDGKPLRSDSEGKKMRPDAVIKYPDNRNVIIDSKVSLNAYTRFMETTDVAVQQQELEAHIVAIKNHIVSLSSKGYDDYNKALDFVMMFIPSEPAYIAAMQGDPNLWNFAYDKRILLMNPTNLITSLKLIVDLWKREYQNQNAIAIAERGAKLYDKFVGFVENLEKVGKHIDSAQSSYTEAYKQLNTGNDNLVLQATKLKDLGVKNKKELAKHLTNNATVNSLSS